MYKGIKFSTHLRVLCKAYCAQFSTRWRGVRNDRVQTKWVKQTNNNIKNTYIKLVINKIYFVNKALGTCINKALNTC